MTAARSSVSAIWRAASAIASAPVASGSARWAAMEPNVALPLRHFVEVALLRSIIMIPKAWICIFSQLPTLLELLQKLLLPKSLLFFEFPQFFPTPI